MNAVLRPLARHNVKASDAARHARQRRREECPRARTGCRLLTEREEWEFFDTVSRARVRK